MKIQVKMTITSQIRKTRQVKKRKMKMERKNRKRIQRKNPNRKMTIGRIRSWDAHSNLELSRNSKKIVKNSMCKIRRRILMVKEKKRISFEVKLDS